MHKCKEAGNTTYTADNSLKCTKQRHSKPIKKQRRLTNIWNKYLFREKWEYRLGPVSDKCQWG